MIETEGVVPSRMKAPASRMKPDSARGEKVDAVMVITTIRIEKLTVATVSVLDASNCYAPPDACSVGRRKELQRRIGQVPPTLHG